MAADTNGVATPPRDNLIRAIHPGVELVRAEGDAMPTLTGHFAVFDQWTEINSVFEGNFMERFSAGAFAKTIRESRDQMRVLFQHGHDPQIGDKVLGPIRTLKEDTVGARYEVPMLDTSYNRDLIPGLEAGLYGASFRFRVMKEEFVAKPKRSKANPDGIPERTVTEAQVREFGPVTFPAYAGATAGLRSLTDEFLLGKYIDDPDRLRELVEAHMQSRLEPEPSEATTPAEPEPPAATTHERETIRLPEPAPTQNRKEPAMQMSIDELRARLDEINVRFREIDADVGTENLTDEQESEWRALETEKRDVEKRISGWEYRQAMIREQAERHNTERGEDRAPKRVQFPDRRVVPDDVHALEQYRDRTSSMRELEQAYRDGAMEIVERMRFPHEDANRDENQDHISRLLDSIDTKAGEDGARALARRIIVTTGPTYQRAFGKWLSGAGLSPDEQRALSLTGSGGGYAIPVTLDPTVILTSNGQVNPLRAISRVIQITGNKLQLVTSAGITAAYAAEATEASDDSPTLAQPDWDVEKAQCFVPFSMEVGEDWGALQSEMARMIQDAKDALEADKFLTGSGHGSNVPEGLLVGATAVVNTAATATFAVADLYSLQNALAPRWRPRASFVANNAQMNRIRQFDTAGGASLWVQLGDGTPSRLLNIPTYEYSNMTSAGTSGASIVTYGDFNQFVIVDRVGLDIELVPHLFGTANLYPTGQRGIYAHWRNTSGVATQLAFKTLKVL